MSLIKDKLLHIIHNTVCMHNYIMYIDVNECAGDHGCHHWCSNTDGSFHCYCNPGYMLDLNGTNCTG